LWNILIEYMITQVCTKCFIPKIINEFPIGRKQCYLCWRNYHNKRNLCCGRTKNIDGSKLKHKPKYDLVGKKFGKLTVIEFTGIKDNPSHHGTRSSFFRCLCDCGKEYEVSGIYLKSGNIKSCGCLIHDKVKEKHQRWSGYGGISGSTWNKIERNAKNNRRAKRRNLEFTITKKYVWELFEQQKGKCALSGKDIILDIGSKTNLQTASLDRIDSEKGYIPGNVQWVHKDVNFMKQDFDEKYFLDMCRTIVRYNTSWTV